MAVTTLREAVSEVTVSPVCHMEEAFTVPVAPEPHGGGLLEAMEEDTDISFKPIA